METIMLNPRQYKIPDWFLNRQKDWKDGTFGQCISNGLDTKLREDLERLKKVKRHSRNKLSVYHFRSVLIVVSVITGSSVSVVNIPRPLVDVAVPSVLPRRSKHLFPNCNKSNHYPGNFICVICIALRNFGLVGES